MPVARKVWQPIGKAMPASRARYCAMRQAWRGANQGNTFIRNSWLIGSQTPI